MRRTEPTLFDEERLNPLRAMELTAESLRAYGRLYRHWAIAYSGGKDSTATLTVVLHLLESGQVPAPETLTVLYADTRMELPPLHITAMKMLRAVTIRPQIGKPPAGGAKVETRVVLPPLDERFMVYMLGRGVPPPTNRFRWCTPQIKVEPMLAALVDLRERAGEKVLMLTGVRVGESAARDQRIALSCGRDGAECGQGWYLETTPESIADTLAPLLHWRVCHVWDWLMHDAPEHGFPTAPVAQSYGGDRAAEVGARTGCVGCNLASKDVALDRVLAIPQWRWLTPLKRLRPMYAELRAAKNRLRKHGETKKDGTFLATDRLGPLTMEARLWALSEVLENIQRPIQKAAPAGAEGYTLIDAEEEARIRELIDAGTWPNRWDGTEDRGDLLRPVRFTRGGGRQMQMMIEEAAQS